MSQYIPAMKYVILITLLLLNVACSKSNDADVTDMDNTSDTDNDETTVPSDPMESMLIDRTWALTHYEYDDGEKLAFPGTSTSAFTIRFTSDESRDNAAERVVEGVNVCNGYSGSYSLEEQMLYVRDMAATEIACENAMVPPALLFERVLFNQQSALMLTLEDDRLEIATGGNEKLIFSSNQAVGLKHIHTGDLAFTEDLSFNEPRFQVLRSHQELFELYDRALTPDCPECEYEPLPFIDWSVSTVVLVAHEIVSSGGYGIAIDAVTKDNDRVTIDVVKTFPGDNCAVSAAFTGPYRLYELHGIFENIDFVERTVQAPAC